MKKIKSTIIKIALLLFVITTICCQRINFSQGRDWVKWKGPFANGTTDEKDWNTNSIMDTSSIVWRADIGLGHSAVAVKGKFVYVFGNKNIIENKDTSDYDLISCLNSENGSEIWTYKYESKKGRFPGPCSSPVIDGKYLYALSRNGNLHGLNASNGELIWKHQIAELGYQPPGFGFSCSPVIYENLVILKVGETGIAFNKKTGKEIWAGDTTGYNSYSSVVLLDDNNEKKLLLLNGDSLHLLEIETGRKFNSYPWKDIGSDAVVNENTVLLSNMQNGIVKLDISKNPPQQIWKNDSIKGLFQGFVSLGNYAYGFTNKNKTMPLRCINLENGNVEWEEDLGKWGSLIIADNKLVIINGKGRLIIADASPEKYSEISSQQIFEIDEDDFKQNKNCCWTSPVLSHGRIYVRTIKGELACIDVRL